MFTQSCIIKKNTLRLRDKLLKLGYSYAPNGAGEWFIPIEKLHYLGVNLYSNGYYMGVNDKWSNFWIDCEDNEELFLAISALQDNSDINQWFIIDDYIGQEELPNNFVGGIFLCKEYDNKEFFHKDFIVHKASVKELFEYFKNK